MSEKPTIDFKKRPFIMVSRDVIMSDAITKPVELAIYSVLCMYADNNTKSSFPHVSTIARMARCSESVARRTIKKLQDKGLIKVEPRYSKHDGKQLANKYTLLDIPGQI